jgi:nicotinamidase-related amidase
MDKAALLIIDAQQEYFAPIGKVVLPDGPQVVARIAEMLRWARTSDLPVFHIVHESRRPGSRGIERVIVSGFMTQMCCDTTTREAAHRGFKVTLLSDATAAMDVKALDGTVIPHDQVHRTHLASLNGFLAEVKRSDEVITS